MQSLQENACPKAGLQGKEDRIQVNIIKKISIFN